MASDVAMSEQKSSNSQIIVSSYVNGGKPSREKLGNLIACMQSTGADVIKLMVEVDNITDVTPIFQILTHCEVLSGIILLICENSKITFIFRFY